MSERRRWWFALGLVVLLVASALVAVWWSRRPSETVWVVRRGDLTSSLELPGRVVALRSVAARAAYDTRVRVVAVQPGDTVEAGDIVAVLDDSPLLSRHEQARQQLLQAEAALAQAEASGAPVETRVRAEEQRRRALDAYREATERLADKYVLAPSDGIVTEVTVTEGAPVGAGTVVARIALAEPLGVSATVDEVDAQYLADVKQVRITVDALPGWEGNGTVVSFGRSASQQAGVVGFPVLVRLDGGNEALRPGMTATMHIDAVLRRSVLLVPERAIRAVGERAFVTVLTDRGREEREVRLGLRSGGMVEVAAGLSEGDRVLLPDSS
ncbi:efflux RND transporter periplasmic adaptor subunit [Thermomicrobium sp. 4228-Ro]|uniref:efflux RND transporter periplasmic adaptor subunit n=1 Tax=Thermomicrobium sp. 4228-Ro TaxID=2993937 RepID=UPI00224930F3|nr:efflux RND transporter periplasmic adaptor subunit [Thermomicrobium sp. 4228-Ro]MCX2727352.1 efflux RND transporter periplasmic adaptor subunit [Thermomicrobium sp. 4228-Ro]